MMKKLAFLGLFIVILFGCNNQQKQQQQASTEPELTEKTAQVLSIDELYTNVANIVDKEVVVKGTVMHVCQHGGQRCFLMGSNEEINIRIEAGEKIGAFGQELMGSEIEIVGLLKEVKTEADAHNPGQEHGDGAEHTEDAETANAHKIIAEAQEAAETVYFIEGISYKEL